MNEATKNDTDKPRTDLVPMRAFIEVAKVMGHGAGEYGAWNYLSGHGLSYSRLIGASLRHLSCFILKTDTDEDSGLPHLAHAIASLMMLYETTQVFPKNDDRYDPELYALQKRDK